MSIIVPRHSNADFVESALSNEYLRLDPADKPSLAVFAYFTRNQAKAGGWTAGRLILDSSCTGYKMRQVELDVGDLGDYKAVVIKQ